MFRKIVCALGFHRWYTVDATNCFATTYNDMPRWEPRHHMVWYQQCSCCGKRRAKDTVKQDSISGHERHNGVELARVNWVENGVMYLGSKGSFKVPPVRRKPRLTVIKGKE
jgi:hypothetical protein